MRCDNDSIAAVILAGGLARRIGGIDKAQIPVGGRPIIDWAIKRLAPQVQQIFINRPANSTDAFYEQRAQPIVPDIIGGNAGPLAGIHAGLIAARKHYRWLISAPCDSPFIPPDLAARLLNEQRRDDADDARTIRYARGGSQQYPVFACIPTSLADECESFLRAGGRKIIDWYEVYPTRAVDFPDETVFLNANTWTQVAEIEKICESFADTAQYGLE